MPSEPAEPRAHPHGGRIAVLALAVAALCVYGALEQRGDAALPSPVAERLFATSGSLDGRPVENAVVLDLMVRGRGVGTPVDTGPAAGVVRTVRDVPDAVVAVTLASALAYVAIAFAVLAPRRRRPGATSLLVAFLAAAVLIAVGAASAGRGIAGGLLSLAFLTAHAVLPATFFASTLRFPGRSVRGARAVDAVLAAVVLLLLARVATTIAPTLLNDAPLDPGRAAATISWLQAFLVAGLAAGLLVLGGRVAKAGSPLERRQATWILLGVALGAAPYAFLRLVPRLLFGAEPPISPAVDRIAEVVVPLAFAGAVARDRLLDIDLIRRRGLVHASVALALCAALFGVLRALFAGFVGDAAVTDEWGAALAVGVPSAAFFPIRQRVARVLDAHLFGIRSERERDLDGLDTLLAALDSREAVERAARGLIALHLDADPVGVTFAPPRPNDEAPPALPGTVHRVVALGPDGGRAFVDLGPKRDGRAFAVEDDEFARKVAVAAGAAVERVGLRHRLLAEEAARAAEAALAAKKADFFARVAHDLRTPVASIRWSVRNLEDGVVGPLAPAQREYLVAVSAAAGQLARLVDHLVEIGRLDLGAGPAPEERVRWDEVAREVAAVLRPVAQARGVRIELSLPADTPAVWGRADGALRIAQNLLDNAVKVAPEGTSIDLGVERAADGGVVVRVRDRGPGLPSGDPARLFELFTRGPAAGGAPGFGIGLHVVRAWTRAMGGAVEARNADGGGAVFECRFPPPEERRP